MKKKKYFLSFIIPIIIILFNFVILSIQYKNHNVFSANEILVADLKSQYVSLFNYLKNIFHGNASLFYSFNSGLGGNMLGTFAYYLSSPLNLLLVFSTTKSIPLFMFIIILIKIGLSGLFMNIYLNHKKNNSFYSIIFSSFYALMAYNMSYYFNLMWLDCIYLTPLILYGIDNIIEKNNGKLYIISLSLSIIFNFYIAYMVCIFSVIYFIYELILNSNRKKTHIKYFIIYSIISVMISSIIVIPTIMNMQNILRAPIENSIFVKKDSFANFLVSLTKLYILPQTPANILNKYSPNVYFGLLPLLYCITFFYGKSSNKEKYLSIGIIIIFFLSFSFDCLNLFWHGLTYPNGYAYRFSFLFSLFMLAISYKSICNQDRIKISKLLVYIFILFFIGIVQLNDGSNISFSIINIILTIIFIVIYYLVTFKNKILYKILLSIIVFIELTIHVNNSFLTPAKLKYEPDYNYYINKICKISNKDEYRFDSPLIFGALESFTCDDKRITSANTLNNKKVYNFFYKSGFNVTYSTITNNNNTPVIYSLLGVKNYINVEKNNNIKKINYYYKKDYKETFYLHQNDDVLPIGYTINNKYKLLYKINKKSNPFEYQNTLLKSMSGLNKNVLIPYKIKKIDDENYNAYINNNSDIYVYIDYEIPENDIYFGDVTINDETIIDIDSSNIGVFKLKNEYKDSYINIRLTVPNSKIYLYYFNEDIFKEHINILNNNKLKIKEIKKNYLKGNIELKKDEILFLSIPYEKGWNIYVDGKKVEYFQIFDTFLGLKVSKGKHVITMRYYSSGIKLGIIMSILGIIIYIIIDKYNQRCYKYK